MIKALIILFILSLPYNNFPYGIGGTLTPLALVPLSFIVFFTFIKNSILAERKINKYIFMIFFIFFIFLLLTIFNDIYFWDLFIQSKVTSPIFRTFQFIVYIFISVGSFFVGYLSLKYFKSFHNILKIILISFLPSLLFGVLEIVFNNSSLLNTIRSFLANTKFPDGYYRIYLLTTEPSWAAFDIVSFLIPISLYFYYKEKNIIYLLLITLLLTLLIFTKSLLGLFTFLLSMVVINIIFLKEIIMKPKYLLTIIFLVTIFISSMFIFKSVYIERIISFLSGGDSSSITRTISYIVAIETFQKYPIFGVGFRNTGYFYGNIVYSKYPELANIKLINDWSDFYSKRFPDVKSTFFEILSSSGVLGLIILIVFGAFIFKSLTKIKDKYVKILFSYIIVASILGSFSINLIGYPIFWFLLGLLLSYTKMSMIYKN